VAPIDCYRRRILIDILDDDYDFLLNISYHSIPVLLKEDGSNIGDIDNKFLEGGRWERERWWYKLAQVCQRWRHLMLASPFHLRLSLVCMAGTPVADICAFAANYLSYSHVRNHHCGVSRRISPRTQPPSRWPRVAYAVYAFGCMMFHH